MIYRNYQFEINIIILYKKRMLFLIAKIIVKRKGKTYAELFEVIVNDNFKVKKIGIVAMGVSFAPEIEYARYKVAEQIGHEEFKLEIV